LNNKGIVRKIDELGRIVIPKEFRAILKISSNDDIEIKVENNQLILAKYSYLSDYKDDINKLLTNLKDIIDAKVYISDKEKIISKGNLENSLLPKKFIELIKDVKSYTSSLEENVIMDFLTINGFFKVTPLIINGDVFGLIILVKDKKFEKEDNILLTILKNLIENK